MVSSILPVREPSIRISSWMCCTDWALETKTSIPRSSRGWIRWLCITSARHTRSGLNERICSRLMVLPSKPPTEGIAAASGGQVQKSVRATSMSWASMAKRVSVTEGTRETIRWLNRNSSSWGVGLAGSMVVGISSLEPNPKREPRHRKMVRVKAIVLLMEGIVAYFWLSCTYCRVLLFTMSLGLLPVIEPPVWVNLPVEVISTAEGRSESAFEDEVAVLPVIVPPLILNVPSST